VYVDDLLLILSKAGVGCFIGLHFVGALAYADDLVLLAPTASAMRKLLAICEDFAREYSISLNALKSKCLIATPKNCRNTFKKVNDCSFYIDGMVIDFVQSFSHLGHLITSDLDDGEDIIVRKHSFIGQVNNILCYFGKLASFVKQYLFHAYCTSYYGCELWSLTNSNVKEFCVAWRKSLRRVLSLPFQTHGDLLPLLSQCLPVFDEICRRSLNFVRSCIRHESDLVQFIALHGLYARSRSLFGRSLVFCAKRFNWSINDLIYGRLPIIINSYVRNSVDETTVDRAAFLRELIMIRDSSLTISGLLSSDELNDIISHVCTS
jgi:hypothetical protein